MPQDCKIILLTIRILKPAFYPYLLHYFRNTFNGKDEILDSAKSDAVPIPITKKSSLIGYGYVIGFNELVVCPNGQVYDIGSSSCKGNNFF